jgi:hypothetical protein
MSSASSFPSRRTLPDGIWPTNHDEIVHLAPNENAHQMMANFSTIHCAQYPFMKGETGEKVGSMYGCTNEEWEEIREAAASFLMTVAEQRSMTDYST